MNALTVNIAPGIDTNLRDGLFIGGAAESAVTLVERIIGDTSLEVVTVDAMGGGRVAAKQLHEALRRIEDGDEVLVVVEGIDALDPMPMHDEAAETREAWRFLGDLSRRNAPLIITATEPDLDAPPLGVEIGAYVAFPLRSRPYFAYGLGIGMSDALDLDDLNPGEVYVRVGGGAPVRRVLS